MIHTNFTSCDIPMQYLYIIIYVPTYILYTKVKIVNRKMFQKSKDIHWKGHYENNYLKKNFNNIWLTNFKLKIIKTKLPKMSQSYNL